MMTNVNIMLAAYHDEPLTKCYHFVAAPLAALGVIPRS